MFRPSASSTYSSATSAMRTQKLPADCSSSGRMASARPVRAQTTYLFCLLMKSFMCGLPSGAIRDAFAQQPGWPQRQHPDQYDEGEDVGVMAAQDATRDHADVARAD